MFPLNSVYLERPTSDNGKSCQKYLKITEQQITEPVNWDKLSPQALDDWNNATKPLSIAVKNNGIMDHNPRFSLYFDQ